MEGIANLFTLDLTSTHKTVKSATPFEGQKVLPEGPSKKELCPQQAELSGDHNTNIDAKENKSGFQNILSDLDAVQQPKSTDSEGPAVVGNNILSMQLLAKGTEAEGSDSSNLLNNLGDTALQSLEKGSEPAGLEGKVDSIRLDPASLISTNLEDTGKALHNINHQDGVSIPDSLITQSEDSATITISEDLGVTDAIKNSDLSGKTDTGKVVDSNVSKIVINDLESGNIQDTIITSEDETDLLDENNELPPAKKEYADSRHRGPGTPIEVEIKSQNHPVEMNSGQPHEEMGLNEKKVTGFSGPLDENVLQPDKVKETTAGFVSVKAEEPKMPTDKEPLQQNEKGVVQGIRKTAEQGEQKHLADEDFHRNNRQESFSAKPENLPSERSFISRDTAAFQMPPAQDINPQQEGLKASAQQPPQAINNIMLEGGEAGLLAGRNETVSSQEPPAEPVMHPPKPQFFTKDDSFPARFQLNTQKAMDAFNQQVDLKIYDNELGRMHWHLNIEGGKLTAEAIVETMHVKEILQTNQDTLQARLNNSGMDMEGLDVSVNQGSNKSLNSFEEKDQKKRNLSSQATGYENVPKKSAMISKMMTGINNDQELNLYI